MGRLILPAIAGLLFASIIEPTNAQSLSSQVLIGAANPNNSNAFRTYGFENSSTSETIQASGGTTFTGLDGNGDLQTMDYEGAAMASAEYLRLRTMASGSVSNTYYNPDNEPLFDEYDVFNEDASPDIVQTAASAEFTDTLQFGGQLLSGYGARYQFRITGNLSDASAFHLLGVTIAGNYEQYRTAPGQTGAVFDFFNTNTYPVNAPEQEIKIRVLSSYFASMASHPDGSNVAGEADFFNTVVLERIDMLDANGDVVPTSEWNVTSASGVMYPVPEPSAFGMLFIGALFAGRRMRNKRDRR